MKRVLCIICALALLLVCAQTGAFAYSISSGLSAVLTSSQPVSAQPAPPVVTYTDVPVSTYVEVRIGTADGSALPDDWSIWYRMDSTDWMEYTEPLAIDINGTLYAKTVNAELVESSVTSVEISCVDKQPPHSPIIMGDTLTWVNDFVDISVVSGTDAESGVLRNEYRLGEEGAWQEYTGAVRVTSPVVFYARTIDRAGNISSMASLDVNNFDLTAPDMTNAKVSFSSDIAPAASDSSFAVHYRGSVTVSIDGAADTQSGLAGYQYQLAGSSDAISDDGWLDYDFNARPVISDTFCGYVCVRALDHAGNISAVFTSDSLVVDNESPVVQSISFSTTEITDSRVIVTFDITDNMWLDSVMVGGSYIGTYDPTFTVFRNGDYTVTAVDHAGNVTTAEFSVKNIDATPFSLLSVYEQLDEDSFTPSTWVNAAAAADELNRLLTVETNSEMVASATEKLTRAMETLVARGDGTMALELIDRVLEYDSSKYTESSWLQVSLRIADIRLCLDDPESTQADVDTARRALEQAVSQLALLGNFSSLDRLISQCESINADNYDPVRYEVFAAALEAAKTLSRTDSTQSDVDSAYTALLSAMDAMKPTDEPQEHSIPTVGYVIIGLLIVFTCTVLFIIFKSSSSGSTHSETDSEPELYDVHPDIGDICFSDNDQNDPQS